MKKARLSVVIVLCITFITSFLSAILGSVIKAKADTYDYTANYKTLEYSDLDERTRRNDKPNKSPQITVFTYGCGGNLAHWSNNQGDENVGNNYQFAYEENSIINEYLSRRGILLDCFAR